jgi:hypothetical protein
VKIKPSLLLQPQHCPFGENWREESTSLFNLFSDEFGEIPLRIRELAVSTAEEKAGDKTKSLTTASALPSLINSIND